MNEVFDLAWIWALAALLGFAVGRGAVALGISAWIVVATAGALALALGGYALATDLFDNAIFGFNTYMGAINVAAFAGGAAGWAILKTGWLRTAALSAVMSIGAVALVGAPLHLLFFVCIVGHQCP